ncbi:STE20-related kinase adapter protein alpha [Plutella xylostella]|uniref:STE20-related kinase adapter protein alpha n=1 Tax=Plutella xylostella TaxID=51655 RepID=UPI002032D84D|nr:STE20-related kinase adapter protein alpha [Plutella xylostella]
MFNPDLSDYQLTSIITECCGGEAVVYSAVYKPNGQDVAVKRYFVDKTKEKEHANLIQQEILTTKELQHPNILPYLTSFVHGRDLYVVSPLMSLGSCRDVLDQYFPEGLPELACAIILRDVLQALQYLHKQLYIHRGIRASHVLLGSDGSVQVSGLRSAASLLARGRRQRQLHSLPPPRADHSHLIWLSPELLQQNLKGYDACSDIYSVGVLACELANGAVPFADVPSTLMFTEKVRGSRPQLLDKRTMPALSNTEEYLGDSGGDSAEGARRGLYAARTLGAAFHQLTELCLQREPEKRPSATQLLNHAFFKQIRKTDFLPSLIGRVKPIKPRPDDMSALLLEEKLSEMDIEKTTEWDF